MEYTLTTCPNFRDHLSEHALEDSVLTNVFDMWWPRLEEDIDEIMKKSSSYSDDDDESVRNDRDLLEEILALARMTANSTRQRDSKKFSIAPSAVEELGRTYLRMIRTHNIGGDVNSVIHCLNELRPPLLHILGRYRSLDSDIEELEDLIQSAEILEPNSDLPFKNIEDEIPF